jgi:hypothetical protein
MKLRQLVNPMITEELPKGENLAHSMLVNIKIGEQKGR